MATWGIHNNEPAISHPPKGHPRKAAGLVEGAAVHGWRTALAELALIYPDRINAHI